MSDYYDDEFVEVGKQPAPPVPEKPTTTKRRMKWSRKKHMRLLVGLPVVYGALLLYLGLASAVIFDWASIDEAKDLAALLSVPGTLAATVIGFFFGSSKGK